MTPPAEGGVLTSLATERDWIGYSPRNYNPNGGQFPSEASMRADLEQLYNAGWRQLYTYTLDNTLRHAPRIAKEVGFETVLAGVFYFDQAQLDREKTAALAEDQHIDGYIVGNEGIAFGRHSRQDLDAAVSFFEGFGKPITTTEVGGLYFGDPTLIDVGDFAFVNIQPWFNGSLNPFDPVGMAQAVRNELVAIQQLRPDRMVVIKEAWWPSAGHPAATPSNQTAFYQALANLTDLRGDPILFAWGESYDQNWKNEPGPFSSAIGPHWGLYEENGAPKQIVAGLASTYTGAVPVNFTIGDYDRDGDVDAADYAEWRSTFGDEPGIPGAAGDGNFDVAVDAADYTLWRDALAAANPAQGGVTGVPEPTAIVLAAAVIASAACGRRVA